MFCVLVSFVLFLLVSAFAIQRILLILVYCMQCVCYMELAFEYSVTMVD
jgi:hypothetical protein